MGQVVIWHSDEFTELSLMASTPLASEGHMLSCLAEVQHPILTNWHVIIRLRWASHWLGRAARPVAAQEKAGWGHQQSPRGILPEGVEDPSEGELGCWAAVHMPWCWDTDSQGNKLHPSLLL